MKSSFPVLLSVLQLPFVLFAQAEPITEDKSKPNVLLNYAVMSVMAIWEVMGVN